MGRISVALQRAWLSWCYDNTSGGSFRAALVAQRDARAEALATGSVVASTSANQHAVSFSAPGEAGFSPADLLEFWQAQVDKFDDLYALRLAKLTPPTTPTDAQVYADMRYALQVPRDVEPDYTGVLA